MLVSEGLAEGVSAKPATKIIVYQDLEIDRRACPQIDMQTGSRFRAPARRAGVVQTDAMWHEPTRAKPPLPPLRAAFLWAISVAPSPQRPPKSSILAGAASFGHGTGMRLGSGQAAAVWRSTGAIMGNVVNDFLLFSCMALFVTGIVLAAASLLI